MPPLPKTSPALWAQLKPLAHQMRHEPTPAENTLWQRLRRDQLSQWHFRRQYAIERFIVDFICLKGRLIIEVDGEIHEQQVDYDMIRQAYLESLGYRMIRFTNTQVLNEIDIVLTEIVQVLSNDV
ncbi:MAG: endonuclease domain-containing protein [Phototrophicaceae bacterium]